MDGAKCTRAEVWPCVALVEMLAGQVIVGAVVSLTVTLKEQRLVFPLVSVATQMTVVMPLLK